MTASKSVQLSLAFFSLKFSVSFLLLTGFEAGSILFRTEGAVSMLAPGAGQDIPPQFLALIRALQHTYHS